MTGVKNLDFSAFDAKKIDEYAAQAKTAWGKSAAYREYEEKMKNRSEEDCTPINQSFMELFCESAGLMPCPFSRILMKPRAWSNNSCNLSRKIFIPARRNCFNRLGRCMGAAADSLRVLTKKEAGGTADFTSKAIDIYADKHSCG